MYRLRVDKKATGWKAFHEGGKWVITKPEKKAKVSKEKARSKKKGCEEESR